MTSYGRSIRATAANLDSHPEGLFKANPACNIIVGSYCFCTFLTRPTCASACHDKSACPVETGRPRMSKSVGAEAPVGGRMPADGGCIPYFWVWGEGDRDGGSGFCGVDFEADHTEMDLAVGIGRMESEVVGDDLIDKGISEVFGDGVGIGVPGSAEPTCEFGGAVVGHCFGDEFDAVGL